jgi:hypothetical protein
VATADHNPRIHTPIALPKHALYESFQWIAVLFQQYVAEVGEKRVRIVKVVRRVVGRRCMLAFGVDVDSSGAVVGLKYKT